MEMIKNAIHKIDGQIGRSTFGRVFRLEGSDHPKTLKNSRFTTEIRAGITTFFTMAYIISINATIVSDSGGPCVCRDPEDPTCMGDNTFGTDYGLCVLGVKRDLITATAAISGLSSFLFGFFTNLPVALG